MMSLWKSWKYKNITLLFLSFVFGFTFSKIQIFNDLALGLGRLGYIGAFFTGMLYVSTFTVTTAAFILLVLADKLPILPLSICAGLGGVVGDITIFRFVKYRLMDEITPIYNRLGGVHVTRVMQTKYLRWVLFVVGAIIIASPFPDEIGVSIMGISKIKTFMFIVLSAVLDIVGIYIFLSLFSKLK